MDIEIQLIEKTAENLENLGFTRVSTEFRIKVGHTTRVIDLVVHDEKKSILLIGEVKINLPDELNSFDPAVMQAYTIAEAVSSPYFLVTDSQKFFWYEIKKKGEISRVERLESPQEIRKKYSLKGLSIATYIEPENIDSLLRGVADLIYSETKFRNEMVFQIISEIVFAKLIDEQNNKGGIYEFQVFPEESPNQTKSRIIGVINNKLDKLKYSDLLLEKIDQNLFQNIVRRLQSYKIGITSDEDIIESAFSLYAFNNFDRNSGFLQTPFEISRVVSKIVAKSHELRQVIRANFGR